MNKKITSGITFSCEYCPQKLHNLLELERHTISILNDIPVITENFCRLFMKEKSLSLWIKDILELSKESRERVKKKV